MQWYENTTEVANKGCSNGELKPKTTHGEPGEKTVCGEAETNSLGRSHLKGTGTGRVSSQGKLTGTVSRSQGKLHTRDVTIQS